MLRRTFVLLPLFLLCACQLNYSFDAMKKPLHDLKNDIHPPKPFVSTPVPADFSIAVDESRISSPQRQYLRQIIASADAMSRITLTTYPGTADIGAVRTTQNLPLTPDQLQALWDLVARNGLLKNTAPWDLPLPASRLESENSILIRFQANGKVHTLQSLNDLAPPILPLLPLLNAGRPDDLKLTPPATTTPATAPTSQP